MTERTPESFTEWRAEVSYALTRRGMKRKDLASITGYSEAYIYGVVCGSIISRPAIEKISDVLGVEPYID